MGGDVGGVASGDADVVPTDKSISVLPVLATNTRFEFGNCFRSDGKVPMHNVTSAFSNAAIDLNGPVPERRGRTEEYRLLNIQKQYNPRRRVA